MDIGGMFEAWLGQSREFENVRKTSGRGMCVECVRTMADLQIVDGKNLVETFKRAAAAREVFDEAMKSEFVKTAKAQYEKMCDEASICGEKDAGQFLADIQKIVFSRAVSRTVTLLPSEPGQRRTVFLTKEGFSVSYHSRAQSLTTWSASSSLQYAFVTQHDKLIAALNAFDGYNSRVVKDKEAFIAKVESFAGYAKEMLGSRDIDSRDGYRTVAVLAVPKTKVFIQRPRYGYGAKDAVMEVEKIRVSVGSGGAAEVAVMGKFQGELGKATSFSAETPDDFAIAQLKHLGILDLLSAKVSNAAQRYKDAKVRVKEEFKKELLTEAL